jgi:hypothetical protein
MGMEDALITDLKSLPEESRSKTVQMLMDAVLEKSAGTILVFIGSINNIAPEVEREGFEYPIWLHGQKSMHAREPDRDRRMPPPRDELERVKQAVFVHDLVCVVRTQ